MRVAFSGSGLLFPIHFGAYRALREFDTSELTEVSGTSGGSLIAATLAFYDVEEVSRIINSLQLDEAIRYNPTAIFNWGYTYGKVIEKNLDEVFGDKCFKDARIPLYVTASDVVTGQPIVFSVESTPDMPIKTALRASIAIPFVFTPVKYRGMLLADGALFDSAPIRVFSKSLEGKTYGIRLRSKQSTAYKGGWNYVLKIVQMMMSAVDHIYVDYDKLNETTELFFLDAPYQNYNVYDNEELIEFGYYGFKRLL